MSDSLQTSYMSCGILYMYKTVACKHFDHGSQRPTEEGSDKHWPTNSQDLIMPACEPLDFPKKIISESTSTWFQKVSMLLVADCSLGSLACVPLVGAMRDLRSLGLSKLQCAALLCMGAPPVL